VGNNYYLVKCPLIYIAFAKAGTRNIKSLCERKKIFFLCDNTRNVVPVLRNDFHCVTLSYTRLEVHKLDSTCVGLKEHKYITQWTFMMRSPFLHTDIHRSNLGTNIKMRRAIAQPVSRWLPTAGGRVQTRV
jgi:hypothetical protein